MIRRTFLPCISLLMAGGVLAACADTQGIMPSQERRMSRSRETIRLDAPDPHFRLTLEERASVREGFDVDALERLLAAVEPEVRPGLLHDFQLPNPGELEPGEFVTPPTRMGDPALQPLLDEVWASAWERFAPDALDDDRMNYPGKEIARQRRRILREEK